MTSRNKSQAIEFVFGPLDGHREPLNRPAEELPERIACFVHENVFRMLDGRVPATHYVVTSVAHYCREQRGHEWVYRFTCAAPPRDVQLPSSHQSTPQQ